MGRQRQEETREEFNSRMRQYYKENKAMFKGYNDEYYTKQKNVFVTYAHLNEEGAIYIGSGNLKRYRETTPSKRNEAYNKAFRDTKIHLRVLEIFNNKADAKKLEQAFIDVLGLKNLVNQMNAIK